MALDPRGSASPSETYLAASPHAAARRLLAGSSAGNERLTVASGATLFVLLGLIGVTILRLGPLLWEHLFIGMLLIPPVALKLASTGYRFARYYTGDSVYRSKGAPPVLLRTMAPVLVLSTVVVLGSGVALLLLGPSSRGTLLPIHKVSFIVWIAFAAVHVLGHLPEMPAALRGDFAASSRLGEPLPGRSGRVISLLGALAAGAVLAVLAIPEFSAWTHSATLLHHHG